MNSIVEMRGDESIDLARTGHGVLPLDGDTWKRHAPTAHYCLFRDKQLFARCSIWATSTPKYLTQSVGVLGHYAAADASAGAALLSHSIEQLRKRGLRTVIGPMDGNTWRRYRLLTQRGSEPPFYLEPDNPDDWPDHFIAAGFSPLARYFSGLNTNLSTTDPRVPEALSRLTNGGVKIRQIDIARFEEELKAVHELSVGAFSDNFLYTPVPQAEFLAMYAPIRPHIRNELVLLAEKEGQLIGFIFGVPDLLEAQRGKPVKTAIAKSLAVRPGRTGAGLGSILMDQFQQAARGLGFTRVIHALMHESNRSLKISTRFGRPFRQYRLYIKEIAA